MQIVVRRYENAKPLFDQLANREQDIRELVTTVPGFLSYDLVRTATGGFSVTACTDADGTAETTRRAQEWIRLNIPDEAVGQPPEVIEGESLFRWAAEVAQQTKV